MKFEDLLPEVITLICERMDFQSVSRFMNTNSRYYQISKPVIKKKKKENICSLIGDYTFEPGRPFTNEDVQRMYQEIVNRADFDKTFYTLNHVSSQGYIHQHILDIPIQGVYFRGNIYRAILAAQKYLFDNSKTTYFFNYSKILRYNLLDDFIENENLEDIINDFIGEKFRDDFRKDPVLYDRFINKSVDELTNEWITSGNISLDKRKRPVLIIL